MSTSSHTIEGLEVGRSGEEYLQLNIKDNTGTTVQEIELNGLAVDTTAQQALDDL